MKVLNLSVQIPLPQIIRKLRRQYLQRILLKGEIVLLFIMHIILIIQWLNNGHVIISPNSALPIVDFEAKTHRSRRLVQYFFFLSRHMMLGIKAQKTDFSLSSKSTISWAKMSSSFTPIFEHLHTAPCLSLIYRIILW